MARSFGIHWLSWMALALGTLLGSGGCREQSAAVIDDAAAARDAGDVATGADATAAAPSFAERYHRARLAEKLRGDVDGARADFGVVVEQAAASEPALAARAALALAELEMRTGNRRRAVELVARAEALAAAEPAVRDQANRILLELETATPQLLEISPAPHAALEGVSAEAQQRFDRAEDLLLAYHQRRVRPRLEELRGSVREKQHALDAAVRAYRSVVALDEPAATVAGQYRIGSLYRDHAVPLLFDLPPELEPAEKARLRRSLRARALGELRRAQQHYQLCLERAQTLPQRVEGWRAAAELGLGAVQDLLRGRE